MTTIKNRHVQSMTLIAGHLAILAIALAIIEPPVFRALYPGYPIVACLSILICAWIFISALGSLAVHWPAHPE